MSFSSPTFLFAFFPIFFLAYYIMPSAWRNPALLVSSLVFYSIDGGYVTGVLTLSIFVNQIIGTLIHHASKQSHRLMLLWFGGALNLVPLVYYKYWMFIRTVGHDVLMPAGIQIMLSQRNIALPAGISFFTFQGLSYLADIYRREVAPARTLIGFGMYHTLFPQLIAGPIVRYIEVVERIYARPITIVDVEDGIIRFCWGLAKKVMIADSMGTLADRMFGLPTDQLNGTAAWIGALAYTLQIYFDFSGYSDMAIGLGQMLGFRFPENFDLPYRALSITEFWRRWHMTLSRWFRDYVYIPLGGNRAGPLRTYVNLFAVFVLCGLWHGAAYTFVVWGCYHGALLVFERLSTDRLSNINGFLRALLRWLLTMVLIVVGWIIFRSTSLSQAEIFFKAMAGFGAVQAAFDPLVFVTPDKVTFFVIGCFLSVLNVEKKLARPIEQHSGPLFPIIRRIIAILLYCYSAVLIAANGFNPFIYFKF